MVFKEAGVDGNNAVWANLYNSEEPQPMAVSPHQIYNGSFPSKNEEGNADGEQVGENAHGLKLLPFEFVALEACLEAACSSLDNEVWISCTTVVICEVQYFAYLSLQYSLKWITCFRLVINFECSLYKF